MTQPDDSDILENFLTDDTFGDKKETARELRLLGVDVERFFSRVAKTVQDGYSSQLRHIAEQEQQLQRKSPGFLTLLASMQRESMLSIFRQLQRGEFGNDYREAALARCRNKDESSFSDEELRSWLEDIGDIWGEPEE